MACRYGERLTMCFEKNGRCGLHELWIKFVVDILNYIPVVEDHSTVGNGT